MMKRISTRNIVRRAAVLFGLLGVIYLTASQASAQCPQWDARRIWGIKQSNKISVRLELNQRGPRISGKATFPGKIKQEHGTITGDFHGDAFHMEIKWDYGETGVYNGRRVEEKGNVSTLSYLVGDAYIKEQPDNKSRRTTWKSSLPLNCYQD